MEDPTKEVSRDVRHGNTRIEVWRRSIDKTWCVSVYPDLGEFGYPGHTYARDEIPSALADHPDVLVAWAKGLTPARPEGRADLIQQ
jgi:hypothetical protein